jgi:hypothetical protein
MADRRHSETGSNRQSNKLGGGMEQREEELEQWEQKRGREKGKGEMKRERVMRKKNAVVCLKEGTGRECVWKKLTSEPVSDRQR